MYEIFWREVRYFLITRLRHGVWSLGGSPNIPAPWGGNSDASPIYVYYAHITQFGVKRRCRSEITTFLNAAEYVKDILELKLTAMYSAHQKGIIVVTCWDQEARVNTAWRSTSSRLERVDRNHDIPTHERRKILQPQKVRNVSKLLF